MKQYVLLMLGLLLAGFGLLLTGCGPLAGVQVRLVEQARNGLSRVETQRRAQGDAVRAWLSERRGRLDGAFDADVRARKSEDLTATWVIESRRAYALGLDAISTARAAHDQADAEAADNAKAADEALAVLLRSLKAQENIVDFGTLNGGGK